jgi:putative ABC transport system permease protein
MVGFALGVQRQAEAPFEKLDLLKNIEIWAEKGSDDDNPDAADLADADKKDVDEHEKEEALVLDDELLAQIQDLPAVAAAYPQFRMGDVEVRHGEKKLRCMAIGVPREFGLIGSGAELLVAGQFFDLGGDEPQVMISEPMVESLGLGTVERAVGKPLILKASGLARRDDDAFEYRTEELTATIMGVYEPPQPAIGPLARTVLLPVDIMKDIPGAAFGRRGPHGHGGASGPPRGYARAVVRVKHPSDLVRVENQLKKMGLGTQTAVGRLEELRTFFVFLDVVLAAVGTVALVVAALGIINTLLMAVLERYQEIGTYKAVGASDGDVVVLFLTEAVLLGLLGGLGGLALGRGVSWALEIGINIYARGQGVEAPLAVFNFPLWLSLATIAFSTLIAVLAGVWPALRAARIDPIRALRGE